MKLLDISKTAIMTLTQRVVEIESKNPIISDQMTLLCFQKLLENATEQERNQILKWKKLYQHGFGVISRKGVAKRVKIIDNLVKDLLVKKPSATVIELASGFDTRFWRINNGKCKFIEIDLPEVILLKKELLKGHIEQELQEYSVLDYTWIKNITSKGNNDCIIIAEGLFMYIPSNDISNLFGKISEAFVQSHLLFEIVPKSQTQGFWGKIVASGFKKQFGLDVSFVFGFKKPSDIETYSKGYKLISSHKSTYGPIILASVNG